jgi:hypothetical protein
MQKVKKIKIKDRFEVCPACGYENGFHIILINDSKARSSVMNFQLKCPNCAQTYDLKLSCNIRQQG